MTSDLALLSDPRMLAAIEELQSLISGHSPNAIYSVGLGEDPDGVYLRVVVDVDDRGEVIDVFLDRLVEFQIDDGLPLYVAVGRPPERNAEIVRRQLADARLADAAVQ